MRVLSAGQHGRSRHYCLLHNLARAVYLAHQATARQAQLGYPGARTHVYLNLGEAIELLALNETDIASTIASYKAGNMDPWIAATAPDKVN